MYFLINFVVVPDELIKNKRVIVNGVGNNTSKVFFIKQILQNYPHRNIIWCLNTNEDKDQLKSNLQFFLNHEVVDVSEYNNYSAIFLYEKGVIIIGYEDDFKNNIPKGNVYLDDKLILTKKSEYDLFNIMNYLNEIGYKPLKNGVIKHGEFKRIGDSIEIYPINCVYPIRVETEFGIINDILKFTIEEDDTASFLQKNVLERLDTIDIYVNPVNKSSNDANITRYIKDDDILIFDDIELGDILNIFYETIEKKKCNFISLNSFLFNTSKVELTYGYSDVLPYNYLSDFYKDIKQKLELGYHIVILSHKARDVCILLREQGINMQEMEIITDDLDEIYKVSNLLGHIFSKKNINREKYIFFHSKLFLIGFDKLQSLPLSFLNKEEKILLLTDKEIFKKEKDVINISSNFLTNIYPNDIVVHIDHGIGIFLGIEQKELNGIKKDFYCIQYANNDKLYVPIYQSEKVTKFIGGDFRNPPKLNRLGGGEWNAVKTKAKKETLILAKQLLSLYAKRKTIVRQPFECSKELLDNFIKNFKYESTVGQIRATKEIFDDMDKETPMDRLLCGDVGFGKTEVAMRAAFKAVISGRQVAMISPITILAHQHFNTFKKRFEGFDVKIAELDRFIPKKDQKDILNKLESGKIDIVIGTHRLLSKDVKFKKLGLLIVDEEQRFGVKQKEFLKSIRTNVDVLSMSATPIPRTLNMSLSGIRDLSIIDTPPPGRLPIITEIRKFSYNLIREAVIREMERNGQVYIIHNKVETIDGFAHKISHIIPEAKIIVAHGKLKNEDLEKRIIDFIDHKYDVLISSTIIENGIDLHNANTLIIDKAENFGLSQLHQLRGRVGRSKIQAYAYFLYHSQKLNDDAKKRLKAIVDASELGAGFQIAMHDLEIRGAGNILGADQHGTVNIIGVNHFTRLLASTIEELKHGRETDEIDVTLDLPIDAYISDDYIPERSQKILIYQKISSCQNEEELQNTYNEIFKVFSFVPPEVENIFKLIKIKILAKRAGISMIKVLDNKLHMYFSSQIHTRTALIILDDSSKWTMSSNKAAIDLSDFAEQDNLIVRLVDLLEKMKQSEYNENMNKNKQK